MFLSLICDTCMMGIISWLFWEFNQSMCVKAGSRRLVQSRCSIKGKYDLMKASTGFNSSSRAHIFSTTRYVSERGLCIWGGFLQCDLKRDIFTPLFHSFSFCCLSTRSFPLPLPQQGHLSSTNPSMDEIWLTLDNEKGYAVRCSLQGPVGQTCIRMLCNNINQY